MASQFRIRPAAGDDLIEVERLEDLVFPNPWDASAFRSLLALEFLVAVDPSANVVGYAIGRVAADEGEVINLAVAPWIRRQGVGAALLGDLLERLAARGADAVFLEVRKSNADAIGVYRRAGFQVVGERRRYYRNPTENALVMRRANAR